MYFRLAVLVMVYFLDTEAHLLLGKVLVLKDRSTGDIHLILTAAVDPHYLHRAGLVIISHFVCERKLAPDG